MVKNEVVALAALLLLASCAPRFEWKAVPMDGHRSGVVPINSENVATGLGVFEGDTLVLPSGAEYDASSSVAKVASVLMDAQPKMAPHKLVIGHSAQMMEIDRDNPDLPLGNLVADAIWDYASDYFKAPMDLAVFNFGSIRVPMPEGPVTVEDLLSMFPFKNCLCLCKIRGYQLMKLLKELSAKPMATSGAIIRVKSHHLESALVGGKPIDPLRLYNVATIEYLLSGGDQMSIGALSEEVILTDINIKDVILSHMKAVETAGGKVDATSRGPIILYGKNSSFKNFGND